MFTWFFYRCTGLRNVLCIIWVSLKCTYSRGKDVSILFATHWEVLKSGMNKIICIGVKRWYYPCVNNLSNLQFFFRNRRKDVGALSILCAGGKFPFHSQTWNFAFSSFWCWTRGRKPRATEVGWDCSQNNTISPSYPLVFLKSFIGSTACVFSFSLNTHV